MSGYSEVTGTDSDYFEDYDWETFKEYPGVSDDINVGPQYSSESIKKIQATNLSYVLGNIADSLSKLALDLGNETIIGNVTTSETYVKVDWKWLILPIYLEITVVGLLAFTVFLSHRRNVPLWKSSILALLYRGIPEATLGQLPGSDVGKMEETARTTFAALELSGTKSRRPRLMRTVQRPPTKHS